MLKNIGSNMKVLRAIAPTVSYRNMGLPHLKKVEEVTDKPLLANRTAFVTNCHSGNHDLASNIALAYAAYGANVLVHGENESHLANLISNFPSCHVEQRHGLIADNIENVSAELVSQFTDKLDILVHNTDVEVPKAHDAASCEVDDFDDVVRQSLTTPFAVVQRLLPLVKNGDNPSIIFCSSTPEIEEGEDENDEVPYYVSKFGHSSSRMLTKMLSNALMKKNIRVNTVDPGNYVSHQHKEVSSLGNQTELAKTSAFVWLGRHDTEMTGAQLDAMDWVRRDPAMFKSFY
mmetsp:Transcript_24208/g.41353  ORF Transcript_24208/g.41353 Transcript_24208/m.41353 type:complete len:289 (+) Transcript_24208:40-906(+)